ncbi:MAG: hypothetical protein J6K32_01530 [Clostridia bacterium]|nr:hypothetical protein [Clostridia bacterium]
MIDEFFDKLVDDVCIAFPRFWRPRTIALADSGPGWRVCLYVVTAWRSLKRAFHHLKSEENAEAFFRETKAKGGEQISELKLLARGALSVLLRLEERSQRDSFCGLFFLMLLAGLGMLAVGGAPVAGCAAALACFWLAHGLDIGYTPVCRGVRQRYLAGMLLRGGGYCALILWMFRLYTAGGLPTNIILQGAMIITMVIHLVFFLAFAAFERQQMLILRLLTGVLGLLPALACAAALALAASLLGGGGMMLIAGVMIAAGGVMLFAMEIIRMSVEIGLAHMFFSGLVLCALRLCGAAFLLCGAWLHVLNTL